MRTVALATLLGVVTVWAGWGQAAKKRVAIFDFDNAAVQGAVTLPFMSSTPANLGQAAANMLVLKLTKDGSATVVERTALDKVLADQNLTNSDRTDPVTAAKLGKILGVDVIILGSITHYDLDDKTKGGGSNPLRGFGGFGGGGMTTKHDFKALVQLSVRLVSPDTAEVVAVAEGIGDIFKKDVKVDMRDTRAMMGGSAGSPLMSEAMDKAIVDLGAKLGQTIPKLPARTPVIDGLIADANESGRLVLNVGSQNGVKVGERLQVWRQGKEIRDPVTGKVLLRDDTLLGEAVVITVNEISSIATFTGAQAAKTGDTVRTPQKQ